jgi:hypothetical protein
MASVRAQIMAAVLAKLDAVRAGLSWNTVLRNPRGMVGEDQLPAIVVMDGGDREPKGLTGNVEDCWLEFSVGWMLAESEEDTAEALLDAAFVAINDALLDPDDVQLGGLAVAIRREAISDPMFGRAPQGAVIMAGQSMDFAVQYFVREGDASSPAP